MNDYDTPEIRCSSRNLSRVTECIDERCWARSLPRDAEFDHWRHSVALDRFPNRPRLAECIDERCWARSLPRDAEFDHGQKIPDYCREMPNLNIDQRCWTLLLPRDAKDSWLPQRDVGPDHCREVLSPIIIQRFWTRISPSSTILMRGAEHF